MSCTLKLILIVVWFFVIGGVIQVVIKLNGGHASMFEMVMLSITFWVGAIAILFGQRLNFNITPRQLFRRLLVLGLLFVGGYTLANITQINPLILGIGVVFAIAIVIDIIRGEVDDLT